MAYYPEDEDYFDKKLKKSAQDPKISQEEVDKFLDEIIKKHEKYQSKTYDA